MVASTQEIKAYLDSKGRNFVKAEIFIGKSNEGFAKKDQQETIITNFKNGLCNTLVATCVAELGLNLGDVKLVVCYDVQDHVRMQ